MSLLNTSSLSPQLQESIRKARLLSCEGILALTDNEFRKKGVFKQEDITLLRSLAATTVGGTFTPAADVTELKENRRITLDCDVLNELLGGGVAVRGVTEVAGESGAGKTQLCLQLALTTQYPTHLGGLAAGVVYICTEDKFPSNRLMQMLPHFPRSEAARQAMGGVSLADNIFVDHISDMDSLKQCVCRRLRRLLATNKIGLIIIDSIAAIFRSEYSLKESVSRARDLRQVGLELHSLNTQYRVAVLTVNQVSEGVERGGGGEGPTPGPCPALGLAWSNLVTTRLLATRFPSRSLHVVWSPEVGGGECRYEISHSGVHGIPPPL